MVNSGKVLLNDERVLLLQTSPQTPSSLSTALVASTTLNTKMTFLLHKRFHLKLLVVVVGLLELDKR